MARVQFPGNSSANTRQFKTHTCNLALDLTEASPALSDRTRCPTPTRRLATFSAAQLVLLPLWPADGWKKRV